MKETQPKGPRPAAGRGHRDGLGRRAAAAPGPQSGPAEPNLTQLTARPQPGRPSLIIIS